MKRTNFREVNKKLSDLKKAELKAKAAYFNAEIGDSDELYLALDWEGAKHELEQFRNTKISEINFK